MTTPNLFDVVLLKTDLPQHGLAQGAVGTILDAYGNENYEVEFTDPEGETTGLLALNSDQFEVIWNAAGRERAQTVQQLVAVMQALRPEQAQEVLDFARFLRSQESATA